MIRFSLLVLSFAFLSCGSGIGSTYVGKLPAGRIDYVFHSPELISTNFFIQKMSTPNLKVHYRASATVAKKYTDLFEARLLIISNKIEQLLEYVDIPENKVGMYMVTAFAVP